MTAGLVVSILGTRLIEGGSDGLVALGILPVVWVAILTTAGELISFASPVIARLFARFSPARVLVASDLLEAVLSAVALVVISRHRPEPSHLRGRAAPERRPHPQRGRR